MSLCSNSVVGSIKFLQVGRHQDGVTEDVTIVDVPLICQATIFLWGVSRVISSDVLCRPTQLKMLDSSASCLRALPAAVVLPMGHR